MLDAGTGLCDNMFMKCFLSFLLGVVFAVWFFPPAPTVQVDEMTRKEIAYEVIDYLEQEAFDTIAAKRNIVLNERRSWF